MTAEWQCVDGRDRVNTGMWWYVMVSSEGETEEFWGGDVTRSRLAQMLLSYEVPQDWKGTMGWMSRRWTWTWTWTWTLGPGDWTWGTGTLDLVLQEQRDAVGLSGDCSFPVSKVGRAVGGTWDMYPTRMQCAGSGCGCGCSLKRGKEPAAATAKTSFLQDSAAGARRKTGEQRRWRVPKITCTWVPVE